MESTQQMHQQPRSLARVLSFCLRMKRPSCPGLVLDYFYFCDCVLLENLESLSSWTISCNSVKGKKKVLSCKDLLQTRCPLTQEASYAEDCQLDTFKGWDGHSIDGSPSLGKGQATGRVDVPVDATATSFDYVDVAPLHRSPQSVVLVNLGSHVEKNEKTIFVKGVE